MLRPFLLIISMPPLMKNTIANLVGVSLFSETFFGDPHQESYCIINAMQNLSQKMFEKLISKLGKKMNWYEVLRRTIDQVLKKNPIVVCNDWQKTYDESLTPHSKLIELIEKEFLLKLSDYCEQNNFYPEEEKSEEELENNEYVMRFILDSIPTVNNDNILKYYTHVLKYYNKNDLNLFEGKFEELDLKIDESLSSQPLPKSLSRSSAILWYQKKLLSSFPKFHSLESNDGYFIFFYFFFIFFLFFSIFFNFFLFFFFFLIFYLIFFNSFSSLYYLIFRIGSLTWKRLFCFFVLCCSDIIERKQNFSI